jgi:hypothetical protein
MSDTKKIETFTLSIPCSLPLENCHEHEKIEKHLAWHGQVDMDMASKLLEHKAPFSYILSSLTVPDTYVLSYVRQDLMVTHTIFKRGDDDRDWEYRNGDSHICKTLDELVCKVMHCEPEKCSPLSSALTAIALKV